MEIMSPIADRSPDCDIRFFDILVAMPFIDWVSFWVETIAGDDSSWLIAKMK